ncbi:MAG: hypothetical protein ACLTK0_06920 [Anaerovoracaceae bacterium]
MFAIALHVYLKLLYNRMYTAAPSAEYPSSQHDLRHRHKKCGGKPGDFTRSRNTIIAALILVCALGFGSLGGITFDVLGASVTLSGLAMASIVGIAANAILRVMNMNLKCRGGKRQVPDI